MATDVARVSYDPARHYTRVVSQQGRVTLEAEDNEEGTILGEERRHELLDIIGPAGTPDDGYALSSTGGFDLTIGAGTMYVGGVRVQLDAPIDYAAQPDWLDHDGDREWLSVPNADQQPANEHVVLELIETDVTAVEDPVLREVALGGPDGAARTRILQRVRRLATDASDCAAATAGDDATWMGEGLVYDPTTAQLSSATRLLVKWDAPEGPADPCEPSAQGGYLGAENQAIRVEVVSTSSDTPGVFDLVWGRDDASMLYRVTADASTNPVLTLQHSPVDDLHRPRAGQAVQLLRSAAALASTDAVVEGYAASLNGPVRVLSASYDPDLKTVQFPAPALAPEFTDPDQTPQLYLRAWEELKPDVALGDEITLTGTGLKVVLSLDGDATDLHPGDFWIIGVRPATPDTVLPARLLRTPQPPDGPRMWLCPLAVIAWGKGGLDILDDCRNPFDPLTKHDDGCCCTVTLRPRDAGRLQELVDKAVAHRNAHARAQRVTICLRPGRYLLDRPLVLKETHSHLHLEGCGEGAIFSANPDHEKVFAQGLITMVHADNVRVSGIEFELPQVRAAAAVRPQPGELRMLKGETAAVYRDLFISIAIRPIHCAQLEIDRCLFRFTVGPGSLPAESDFPSQHNVFGVGVFAGSECWGLELRHNRFLHDAPKDARRTGARAPLHVLVGVLLAPSLVYRAAMHGNFATKLPSGSLIRPLLERGRIERNEFSGLTAAVALFADLGELRIEDNVLRDCYGGAWLSSLRAEVLVERSAKLTISAAVSEQARGALVEALTSTTDDPFLTLISVVARSYPLPKEFLASGKDRATALAAQTRAKKADQVQWTQRLVDEAAAPFAAIEAAGEAKAVKPEPFVLDDRAAAPDQHPLLLDAARAQVKLSDFERAIAFTPSRHRLRLRVTGNDLDCAVGSKGLTGPALQVWDTDDSADTSALISDNRMSGRRNGPIALLLRVPIDIVTSNLIRNANAKRIALAVVGATEVAITGNIVQGGTLLPAGRPFAPPLDRWGPLNTGVS